MKQNKQYATIIRTARMPKGSYEQLYTTKESFEGSDNIRPTLYLILRNYFIAFSDEMPFTVLTIFKNLYTTVHMRIYNQHTSLHTLIKGGKVDIRKKIAKKLWTTLTYTSLIDQPAPKNQSHRTLINNSHWQRFHYRYFSPTLNRYPTS